MREWIFLYHWSKESTCFLQPVLYLTGPRFTPVRVLMKLSVPLTVKSAHNCVFLNFNFTVTFCNSHTFVSFFPSLSFPFSFLYSESSFLSLYLRIFILLSLSLISHYFKVLNILSLLSWGQQVSSLTLFCTWPNRQWPAGSWHFHRLQRESVRMWSSIRVKSGSWVPFIACRVLWATSSLRCEMKAIHPLSPFAVNIKIKHGLRATN
jgi:hypothetical protein